MSEPDQLSVINQVDFDNLIASEGPEDLILLVFVTEWSGPCNQFKEVLDKVVDKIGDKLLVLLSDLDKEKELGIRYDCRAAPSHVLFRGGEIVAAGQGCATLKQLLTWIDIRSKF